MPEIPKLDAGLIIEKQIFLVLLVMCYAGHRGIVRFGDLRWKSIGEEERDKVYIYLRLHEDRGAYAPPCLPCASDTEGFEYLGHIFNLFLSWLPRQCQELFHGTSKPSTSLLVHLCMACSSPVFVSFATSTLGVFSV